MKRRILLLLAAVSVVVITVVVISVGISASKQEDPYVHSVGYLYQQAKQNQSQHVVIEYHGNTVTAETLDYYWNVRAQSPLTETAPTKREIAEDIVRNMILLEVGRERGLEATQEELEGELDVVRSSYMEGGAVKDYIDSFCEGAGITFEEYMQILYDQQARHITRIKLSWQIAQEWCDEHGVEYSRSQPPEGMQEAVEAELDRIVAAHMGEAVFFVD